MEIIGFIALIIFGLWLVVGGFGGAFAALALSGKMLWPPFIFGIIGLFVLYQAVIHSPFSITMKG